MPYSRVIGEISFIVIIGAVVSTTLITNTAGVATFPALSEDAQVIVVLPILNVESERGSQEEIVTEVSILSVTFGAVYLTIAPEGPVASIVSSK